MRPTAHRHRHTLHPQVRAWLRAGVPATPPGDEKNSHGGPGLLAEADWGTWLLGRMAADEILDLGGVLVDRAVLEARFACVSCRCAPSPGRGAFRSCCADVAVPLTLAERRRLARHGRALQDLLVTREPRLRGSTLLDASGIALARPGGRCVFSSLTPAGRLRCRLHRLAPLLGVERRALQPMSCRLFPLIIVDGHPRGPVLTLVNRRTHRLVGALPPRRYPCLVDPGLPPLISRLAKDLDFAIGSGFAQLLRRTAR